MSDKVKTCFWFDHQGLEAAEFYVSIIPGSSLGRVSHYADGPDKGKVLTVEFSLAGTSYMALNGGPHFTLSEAASISVTTEDQAETDRLWAALLQGGVESQCGWLKDRFGLSWQIVPQRAIELLNGPDAAKVWPVLMNMVKIEVAELEAAAA
ncbi:VOC family protein [Paracoccus caeni]|uniref:VOC family protein n=1 Tax=Paracoccus caeni TaxID=657651 RepID=A0A934VV14_9RHOB|nr:VOC family protein [Paracoccus caeni]MBK4216421.1 VOC family protein [Paracoccus caeni]